EPVELLRAVRAVAAGDALLSPGVTRRLIGAFATQTQEAPRRPELDTLTEREREVMGLVAEGLSNDEIAARLYVSPMTAKTHVSRAMTKLAARDRAQLVVFAYESGLVRPGWVTCSPRRGRAEASRRTTPATGPERTIVPCSRSWLSPGATGPARGSSSSHCSGSGSSPCCSSRSVAAAGGARGAAAAGAPSLTSATPAA